MQQVVYIIGASGSGKSTEARALADARRAVSPDARPTAIISTDVIRAELRAVLPRDTHPELWAESFDVPPTPDDDVVHDVTTGASLNVTGFLRQCAPVLRATEAAVDYLLTEGVDCIVEGVHLVPGSFAVASGDGVEASLTLRVVDNVAAHRELFVAREHSTLGGRPAARYHEMLGAIRLVQMLLIERADQFVAGNPHVDFTRVMVQPSAG